MVKPNNSIVKTFHMIVLLYERIHIFIPVPVGGKYYVKQTRMMWMLVLLSQPRVQMTATEMKKCTSKYFCLSVQIILRLTRNRGNSLCLWLRIKRQNKNKGKRGGRGGIGGKEREELQDPTMRWEM